MFGLIDCQSPDGRTAPFLNYAIDTIVQFEALNAAKVKNIRSRTLEYRFVQLRQQAFAKTIGRDQMSDDGVVAACATNGPQITFVDAAAIDFTPRQAATTETHQADFDEHGGPI